MVGQLVSLCYNALSLRNGPGSMKITIVTPVFNDVRVGRALDSILAQQHRHELELVVVDAGSRDDTLEVLETYRDRLAVFISEPDSGIFDGMNKGIRHATGEVVGILNADDCYSDPLVLRDVADAFSADAGVEACYGDLAYTNPAGRVVRYWKAGESGGRRWLLGWMPPHPTFFVRRRVYDRYGLFDLQYPIAADYELMLRLMFRHRIKVKYLNRAVLNMAPGGNSTRNIKSIVKANLEVGRAWRNNGLGWGMFLAPCLKPARKLLQLTPFRRQP